MNALDYLLKANLYGLLFVSCYWFFLRRHTFFSLNRFYLLTSVILSLSLPLVTLPAQTVETLPAIPVGVMALPVTTLSASTVAVPEHSTSPDWQQLGVWGYGFIALILFIRLGIRVGRLLRLIHQSPRQMEADYVLVQPNNKTLPTFSFFSYVILNPADTQNELILRHELVHVRQWHSADVLGLSIVQAIFWACPALLLMDRMLRQAHEFLADKPASQPTEYAKFLVAYSFGTPHALQDTATLTNSFFTPSLLKQRIIMLHQKATTRWALSKYVLVLPLAFSLLAMTTAREEITSAVNKLQDDGITVTGKVTGADGKPLPGAMVIVANTDKGTPTDQNGFYKLTGVSGSSKLAYSHIGYRTDVLLLDAFKNRTKNNQLWLSPKLTANIQDELPPMGATAAYKAIKPNPSMPVRTPPSSETINGRALTAVEEPAVFPTGIPGLMQYVAHTLRYPAKARASGIQGDVYVLFTVLPTGAVGGVKINRTIKRIGGGCEEEAIRIISQMPKWIPAKQNSKPVAVRYQLPVRFTLEKGDDKRTGQVMPEPNSDSKQPAVHSQDNNEKAHFALFNAVQASSKERYATPLPDSLKPSRSTITIRSNGFDVGEPLYIIDGIYASKEKLGKLDPNSILNIDVQKGPSAAVLHGEKARYGVVNITTKNK